MTDPNKGAEAANLPARMVLDRPALERVLARAAELQAADGDRSDGLLTDEQILEVGREVGISPRHLQQALAEERTRITVPEDPGWAGRLAGPAVATASRTVRGRPADVLAVLDAWMQREECLQVRRRFADRVTWEPRRDFFTKVKRDLDFGGRGYHLSRAQEVAATVLAVDEGRVFVRLDADLAQARTARIRAGGVAAIGGVGTGAAWLLIASNFVAPGIGPLLVGGAAVALVPALAGVGLARALTRAHARTVARIQLALDQALDRLERGEFPKPPGLLQSLTGGLLK